MEKEKFEIARGEKKADLVIKNAKVVNVFSCEIIKTNVAVYKQEIIGIGDYHGEKEIDIKESYLLPGLIDGHLHLESSCLSPFEFAKTVVPWGVTSVIIDPHEIANVLGKKGIKYILRESENIPLDIFIMLPSCVPATDMETSGAKITADDLKELSKEKKVLGLAEVMNFPGVVYSDCEVLNKIKIFEDKIVDGHSPLLSGKSLCAYISAGIKSDHECTNIDEAKEKLRLGMCIMIREGSTAKNLKSLVPLVTKNTSRRFIFVSDDKHSEDLIKEGSINHIIKKAIKHGISPVCAIQMATINTAEYFGLKKYGAIAPSYFADMVVVDDLRKFNVKIVFKKGEIVAEKTKFKPKEKKYKKPEIMNVMKITPDKIKDIKVKAQGDKIKVIELIPNEILTRKIIESPKIENGYVVSDIKRDILKICVFERYTGENNFAVGFIKGFSLKSGAIGTSVAHDSHNIVIVGTNDEDILFALKEVVKLGGGKIVVNKGKILEKLALPIAGLISDEPINIVNKKIRDLILSAKSLGCKLSSPFMSLSFLTLPVIPELKITDKGLVDVNEFKIVSLFL